MKRKVTLKIFIKTLFRLLYLIVACLIPLLIGFIIIKNSNNQILANCFFAVAGTSYVIGVVVILVLVFYKDLRYDDKNKL